MTLTLAVRSPEVVRVATVVKPVNVGEALGAKAGRDVAVVDPERGVRDMTGRRENPTWEIHGWS